MKKIFIVICILFFSNCSISQYNTVLHGKNSIEINHEQLNRFSAYLNGKYYSYELKREIANQSPLMFAITKDGSTSILLSCNSLFVNECNSHMLNYMLLERFKKKYNKQFFIFAIEDKIVWDEANLKIIKNKNIEKQISKIKNINFTKEKVKNIFVDFSLLKVDEDGSSNILF